MTAALPMLTLALLGQADGFTLRFDGFVETQEMKQEPLTAMFRSAFEQVSDASDSNFGVIDQGPVDVVISAAQQLDDQGLVFRWFLSTVRCPGRTYDFMQHRPKKALDMLNAQKMVREVAKNADLLRRERIGHESAACAEDGESLGGTVSNSGDPTLGLTASQSGGGGMSAFMAAPMGGSGQRSTVVRRGAQGTQPYYYQTPTMTPAHGFTGSAVRGTEPTNAVRGTEPTNAVRGTEPTGAVRGTEPTLSSPLSPRPAAATTVKKKGER